MDRLEIEPSFTAGYSEAIVSGFRKVMGAIRAAVDERDLYAMKGLRFKKMKPPRDHQHSLRINDQWRLVIEFQGDHPNKKIEIIGIEDYH